MPRTRTNVAEPVKPVEPEEKVDLNEPNEVMEEEVEYEEVEEVEEEVEIEEEVVKEEVVEEQEETTASNGANVKDDEDGDESERHAALLALPPHDAEVYVGGIPSDASEEDIKRFCESVGEVVEVRMMKDHNSSVNNGHAFVTFRTKKLAKIAIGDLNNTEFMGKRVKCSAAQAKHKLYIGNVPRNWVEDDMRKAVSKFGPGVTDVVLVKDQHNFSHNRGYAFIEYHNHDCAEYSRKKMSNPKFKLDSNAPTVSWADPKSGNSAPTSQIKAVYVKNLPKTVTQDQLKKLFEHHGDITKVVVPPAKSGQENRIGFVHFVDRSAAMKALKNTERYELDGQVLECSLAKPPAADKKGDSGSNAPKGALLPGYGYGVLPAGYGQPMVYGRGPTPGVVMVPMILPDGCLGYALQQPGALVVTSQHGGGHVGNSGQGRQSNDNSRGPRFQPY